jgi:hypothetical protein
MLIRIYKANVSIHQQSRNDKENAHRSTQLCAYNKVTIRLDTLHMIDYANAQRYLLYNYQLSNLRSQKCFDSSLLCSGLPDRVKT